MANSGFTLEKSFSSLVVGLYTATQCHKIDQQSYSRAKHCPFALAALTLVAAQAWTPTLQGIGEAGMGPV